jgi:hypothetical protein
LLPKTHPLVTAQENVVNAWSAKEGRIIVSVMAATKEKAAANVRVTLVIKSSPSAAARAPSSEINIVRSGMSFVTGTLGAASPPNIPSTTLLQVIYISNRLFLLR